VSAPVERLQPPGWPRPRGYSNGYRIPAGLDLVLTGGMVGWDDQEQIVPGGFVAQFEQVLRNILTVVAEAGGGPEHVVRLTVYVVDRDEYLSSLGELGAAWKRTMGRNYPAMALVQIAGLVEDGARVEIEGTAAVPPRGAAPE
jgi:enamine deaminase RidA (YjgF/YER057c/UK114 family)